MSKNLIQPRVLKGFRDYLPQLTIPRTEMIDTIKGVFSSFGFAPIDTPALEYAEILLGKGSDETDKQLYRFQDQGKRDVALRFDLTVPLARFVAMHINELGTPFRRYHIAPVWRAEKPQRGRYREFIQCDFDIIGTRSALADAEIVLVIDTVFSTLGIGHQIKLNNRRVLNGFLRSLGALEQSVAVLRAIDKLDKIGPEAVTEELAREAGLSPEQIKRVGQFTQISQNATNNQEILRETRKLLADDELGLSGIFELEQVLASTTSAGVEESRCRLDLAIARGLDYYTGSVFETKLTELPEIGSVCSGGRYDDLASLYSKRELPGVGASVGLDRLLAALEELGHLSDKTTTASILVTVLEGGSETTSFSVAQDLRRSGLSVEMYPERAKLGTQLKYADRKKIERVVLLGAEELAANSCRVKEMTSGQQSELIALSKLADYLGSP